MNEIIQLAQQGHVQQTYEAISQLNITGLFSNLKNIRNQLILEESTLSKMAEANFNIRSNVKITNINSRKNLFAAYETIQQIRYKITNQPLNYRLYITDNYTNTAKYIEVGASQLENFIGYHSKALDIAVGKIKEELNSKENKEGIKKGYLIQYADAMTWMRHPSGMNKNFFIQTDSKEWTYGTNKQGERMIVTYNRGHIIEAVDKIIVSQAIEESEKGNFNQALFYKYLKQDSVSGFKGGDTYSKNDDLITQTQIKANSARLMRYGTIIKAINSVIAIGDQLELIKKGQGNREQVISEIKKIYSDDSGKISTISEKLINDFIDKFLKENLSIVF